MSQFREAKIDIKDEKKALPGAEKILLLTEVDIAKEDLRELHRNTTVFTFDAEINFDSNILGIFEKFDTLVIDVREEKNLRWYKLMRSAVENKEDVNVVYYHKKGVPITTKDHLKVNLAVDFIIKEMPKKEDYNGKADYLFKLLSDHIPIVRNYWAIFRDLFSCVIDQVNEKPKN